MLSSIPKDWENILQLDQKDIHIDKSSSNIELVCNKTHICKFIYSKLLQKTKQFPNLPLQVWNMKVNLSMSPET